jgi:hypothetical protein
LAIHTYVTSISSTHPICWGSIRPAITSRSGTRVDPIPIPIETGIIVCVSLTSEKIAEHSPKIGNVGFRLELETAAIGQILSKLTGASLAESRDSDRLLFLHDELVFFGGRLSLEALPGETALQEVNEDVSDTFEIVTARLLHTQVIVDGSVTGGSRE